MHNGTVIDQLIETVERAEERVRAAQMREPKPAYSVSRLIDSVFDLARRERFVEVA